MAVGDTFDTKTVTFEKLIGKPFDDAGIEALFATEAAHIFFEIVFEVLKDEDQFAIGVDDLSERDNVGVG